MTPFDRQLGLQAALAIKEAGTTEGFPQEIVQRAMGFAPAGVELVRMGKVRPDNSPAALRAVCAKFVTLRPGAIDAELDRHEQATDAELLIRGGGAGRVQTGGAAVGR
jgi:hypothetical protein